ncbi:hydantoinase B/oxoprolinase family protein [Mycobacterium sp. NPDC003449]
MSTKDFYSVDGVQLAVLSSRLENIALAMMNTLARSGRSGVLNTARDFSCCIVTADARLMAMAESLPIHVMRGPDLMGRYMAETHPNLAAGDAYLHNSPYHGNSHAADHTILVPVIVESQHRFTVLVKAHQADCGNATPTTYSTTASDVYTEGALIFPCVQVQRDYEDIDDIIRMCRARIRVPDQWWGDYLAMMGAARIGERQLNELGSEVGWDVLENYTEAWFDYSEQRMINAINKLPAGRVSASSSHDPFPGLPDGVRINVTVDVKPEDATIEVDLTDNVDCQPSGLNLTEATSLTAAMIGVFNSIGPGVPPNAGSFRRLSVRLRENCIVGIPRHPASCSVATTNVADRVANAVQAAMATLGDGVGMAEAGASQPPAWAVLSGTDSRNGEPFVNQILLSAVTGGPGGPQADGWLTLGHVGNAGMMLRDSVEIAEIHHPVRVVQQRILPDTEGAGRFRGAPAALAEYGPIEEPLVLVYGSDGGVNAPKGVRGGRDGGPAQQFIRDSNGLQAVGPAEQLTLTADQTVVSISCGGGGYGDPTSRELDRVVVDVVDGIITRQRAKDVYGIVLQCDSMDLDVEATDRQRTALGLDS